MNKGHTGIFKSTQGGKNYYTVKCPETGIYHGQFPSIRAAAQNRLHKSALLRKVDNYKKELQNIDKRDPKKPSKTGLKIKEGISGIVVDELLK